MSLPLLVTFFRDLPAPTSADDTDLWEARMQHALRAFRRRVVERYTEATLQRLLESEASEVKRAAVAALGLVGTMDANAPLARLLHDDDEAVAGAAADALWEVWFRGGSEAQNVELQRVARLADPRESLKALDALCRNSPDFAEAVNQRAVAHFRLGDFKRSAADCRLALELNPYHFGAQAGLGQCLLKLHRYTGALAAFRLALEINPLLSHLSETIELLDRVVQGDEAADE